MDRFYQDYTVYLERAGTLAERFSTTRETRASNFGNPDGLEYKSRESPRHPSLPRSLFSVNNGSAASHPEKPRQKAAPRHFDRKSSACGSNTSRLVRGWLVEMGEAGRGVGSPSPLEK